MEKHTKEQRVQNLKNDWSKNPRWAGVLRPYSAEEVIQVSGTVHVEHSLARRGAERLWSILHSEGWVGALGAMTGNQAIQEVTAGMKAIYLSGWQVAADANLAGEMYPDQSLYPVNSVPATVKRINNALLRRDQIEAMDGEPTRDWMVPIVADAEAGFGGNLNAFELMKHMIEAGAAGVHWEDQLASAKKMWPPWRKGFGTDPRGYSQISGRPPCGRFNGCSYSDYRSNRRRGGEPHYF